jgi:hypothetical protein
MPNENDLKRSTSFQLWMAEVSPNFNLLFKCLYGIRQESPILKTPKGRKSYFCTMSSKVMWVKNAKLSHAEPHFGCSSCYSISHICHSFPSDQATSMTGGHCWNTPPQQWGPMSLLEHIVATMWTGFFVGTQCHNNGNDSHCWNNIAHNGNWGHFWKMLLQQWELR